MLRLFSYVIGLAVAVAAAVWLADRPGAIRAEWLGWRVETSVPVLLAVLGVAAGLLILLLRLLGGLWRLPARWCARRREINRRKGYQALSDGLAAAASGQAEKTRRLAGQARKLLADPALTSYLSAQAAKLAGQDEDARQHYHEMLDRPETAALGLRGLLDDALKGGDDDRALELAERCRIASPADPWLVDLLFSLQVKAGRLREAQELLLDAARRKALPPAEAAHRRALVLNERAARAEAEGDRRAALSLARDAAAADPDLTVAVARLARLQQASGQGRRATASLLKAWTRQPAQELLRVWEQLVPGEAPLARLRRLEKLTAAHPDHALSHLALSEAALAAKLWGQARRHLTHLAETAPSARAFRLLARLEQEEYQDGAAAQRWRDQAALAPPEPQWRCAACHGGSPDWRLVCPQCGEIDRLVWG